MSARLRLAHGLRWAARCLIAVAGTASAATLYVSPTGSDTTGNGSMGSPYRQVQKAVGVAAFTPGSDIVVMDGTYSPFFIAKTDATAGARYTIRSANQYGAKVTGTVLNDSRNAAIHVTGKFITIDGFDVDVGKTQSDYQTNGDARTRGIRVSGEAGAEIDGVRILNNRIANAGWCGITTSYALNILIEKNTISNSWGQHGIYVSNTADGPILRGNISHDNAFSGLQINGDPESAFIDQIPGADGIISNALVEQNIVYNNHAGGSMDFASIRNSIIRNNLSYDNTAQGIVLWDDGVDPSYGSMNNLIANNTIVMPSGAGHTVSMRHSSTGNTFRNNILIHLGNNDSIAIDSSSQAGGFTSNYNVVTKFENAAGNIRTLAQWQTETGQDLNSIAVGTSTTTFSNYASRIFTLAATSVALNTGTTVAQVTADILGTARPQGAAYDIGAYETVSGNTAPGAPTGVVGTAGVNQVSVAFVAPASNGGSAITGYTATCGAQNASGPMSPIVVTGLTGGVAVTCTVIATNAVGNSVPSSPSAGVTPTGVPGAPTNAVATAGVGQASVAFTAPTNNGGSAITGFTATCGGQSAGGAMSPIVVTGLPAGVAVTCTVTATNAIGTGAASTASNSVTPTGTPGAPTGVSAVAGTGNATVSFTAPSNNGGSAITGYTATCGGQSNNGAASPIVVGGLAPGMAVTCTVKATNAIGTGPASAPSNSVTPPAAPGAPTLNSGVAGDAQLTLLYAAPASDGGLPITRYDATCVSNPLPNATGFTSMLSITLTGLTNGAAYDCTVTATNAAGTGAPSNIVSVTPSTMAALALTGAVSRRMHGAQGPFEIPLDIAATLAGAVSVEPRAIGGGHRIVFQFNQVVTSVGGASATSGAASVESFNGKEAVVVLTGVSDNQRSSISVSGVNGSLGATVSVGFLVGDVTGTRTVNAADISAVKARSGSMTNTANFRTDINLSGGIDSTDVSAVKLRSGRVLAP